MITDRTSYIIHGENILIKHRKEASRHYFFFFVNQPMLFSISVCRFCFQVVKEIKYLHLAFYTKFILFVIHTGAIWKLFVCHVSTYIHHFCCETLILKEIPNQPPTFALKFCNTASLAILCDHMIRVCSRL